MSTATLHVGHVLDVLEASATCRCGHSRAKHDRYGDDGCAVILGASGSYLWGTHGPWPVYCPCGNFSAAPGDA